MTEQLYQEPVYTRIAAEIGLLDLVRLTCINHRFQKIAGGYRGYIWRIWIASCTRPADAFQYIIKKLGPLELVELFIASGVDIHADNDLALDIAIRNGYLGAVKVLLPLQQRHYVICASLRLAIERGHLDIVKFIFERFPSQYYAGKGLKYAAGFGHISVVEYLLQQGIPADYGRHSALKSAICNGRIDIVKLLVEYGADIAANENEPLFYAIFYQTWSGDNNLAEWLLDQGVHDDRMLVWAANAGSESITRLFLQRGHRANCNEAYTEAITSGHYDIAQLLLDVGADPAVMDF